MGGDLQIGGAPLLRLDAPAPPAAGPAFVSAGILPGRGMMLLQAGLQLASGDVVPALHAPAPVQAAAELDGGPDDFAGDKSFSFGGALLAPFANRITGRPLADAREIETTIDGHAVRLPRNWGGKAPGAAQYAMHGLILDARADSSQPAPDRVQGRLPMGDFGGHWPGRTDLSVQWRLVEGRLELEVSARNIGDGPLPLGLGWHPYFALPSGQRRQARLRLSAGKRAEVHNYDEVLPTGRLLDVAGTPYDFSGPEGAALGDLYLDDCFTDLVRTDGEVVVEIHDPAAGLGLRIASPTPEVKAVQVYAPPDQAFVVIEPQFNLADPFAPLWPPGVDTGMARLAPGAALTYRVSVTPFDLSGKL